MVSTAPFAPRLESDTSSCGKGLGADTIRILISTPQPLLRLGIQTFLHRNPGMAVVGECKTLSQLPAAVEKLRPKIVLFGHCLKSRGWDTPVEAYVGSGPAKLILLVAKLEQAQLQAVFTAGFHGVYRKTSSLSVLQTGMREVGNGRIWCDPKLTGDLLESFTIRHKQEQSKGLDGLTPRQRQIVTFVQQGLTNQEIARRVLVSEATVAWSLTQIYRHFGVGDRIRLVMSLHANGV